MLFALPLLFAVPSSPPASVPAASFRMWQPSQGRAHWTSAGVRIDVAPAACATPPPTEGCRFGARNNQGDVTVTAPGLAPFRITTDRQSAYYRIAVVRFDRRDARPGLVIENQSGGSSGDVRVQLLVAEKSGFRTLWLPGGLQGQLPATLKDLSGDGRVDFVLGDGRFAYTFGCGACTPRPPLVMTLRGGRAIDVSREAGYASIYRAEIASLRRDCFSGERYRNGACAAYVANAARIGQFDAAWRKMLPHWDRQPDSLWQSCDTALVNGGCPAGHASAYRTFPESLHAFLKHTGYIR